MGVSPARSRSVNGASLKILTSAREAVSCVVVVFLFSTLVLTAGAELFVAGPGEALTLALSFALLFVLTFASVFLFAPLLLPSTFVVLLLLSGELRSNNATPMPTSASSSATMATTPAIRARLDDAGGAAVAAAPMGLCVSRVFRRCWGVVAGAGCGDAMVGAARGLKTSVG